MKGATLAPLRPIEDADTAACRKFLETMDSGNNLVFSMDHPRWS